MILPLLLGCPKQKPTSPAAVPPPPPGTVKPVEEISPPAAPSTSGDQRPNPLSEDLETAMRYAYEQGLLGDVYFDFDRYELKPEARERLNRNAEFLRAHPEFTVTLEGHCDERGTNEYNLALGDRRAAAASDYLVSLNVAAGRLRSISYGEEQPVCSGHDESCWWRNRRAHFVLTGRAGR